MRTITFHATVFHLVLRGHKTTTRRPAVHASLPCEEGETMRAHDASGPTRCVTYIRVTSVALDALHNIDEADAQAEGFESIDDFADFWDGLYGHSDYAWALNPRVWVIGFTLAEEGQG
jgi:uncharacterized protein YqfB (UPF0267 family)